MLRDTIRFLVACTILGAVIGGLYWNRERMRRAPVTRKITCENNMRMIGVGFKIWAAAHDNQYPFNISTNLGGTREFCAPDHSGFDSNSLRHFQALASPEYLSTPLLLVCPEDRSKKPAKSLSLLRNENLTYRVRTGTNITLATPREVLLMCPVHGYTLLSDGTLLNPKKNVIPPVWTTND